MLKWTIYKYLYVRIYNEILYYYNVFKMFLEKYFTRKKQIKY